MQIYLAGSAGKGRFALVDAEDYDRLSQFKWYLGSYGYAVRNLPRKEAPNGCKVKMHSEITGYARTDHKNRNKLDNRKENLRDVLHGENMRNLAKRKGRLYTGVSLDVKGLYRTHVKGDRYGVYSDAKVAALVVDEVKRRLWAGSIFVENLPNERLPEGFKIVNLDYPPRPKAPTRKFAFV